MTWSVRHPGVFYPGFAGATANAVYLAYVSLESFMLETGLRDRISDSMVIFLSSWLLFLLLYLVSQIPSFTERRLSPLPANGAAYGFGLLGICAVVLVFTATAVWMVHLLLAGDIAREAGVFGSLLFEAASIAFLVGRDRGRLVRRQLLMFFTFCMSMIAGGFVVGAYERISGEPLGGLLEHDGGLIVINGSALVPVFGLFAFHMATACYLFYCMLGLGRGLRRQQ